MKDLYLYYKLKFYILILHGGVSSDPRARQKIANFFAKILKKIAKILKQFCQNLSDF
jgi:hypothetical protein